MISRFRPKLTYANVVASIALFIALGGAAVAAGLPRNSVGPKQLRRGAVTTRAIKPGAVVSGKLANRSVIVGKLGPNAVTPSNIGNGAVSTSKIAAAAVIASSIKNGVITTNKLTNANVTTAKLADGSVTNAKIGPEVAPLLGTLKTGQTLRGTFDVGGFVQEVRSSESFPFPLVNPPAAAGTNVLGPADPPTAACPGLKGGNLQTPEAAPGQLCVYLKVIGGELESFGFDAGTVNRLGFGLNVDFKEAKPVNQVQGFWAVTAP
jgi:hypothetical protein